MYFVECISALKQVYAYAVSKGASDNDLLIISQAQIVSIATTEEPPAVWNSKNPKGKMQKNGSLLNSSTNRFLF